MGHTNRAKNFWSDDLMNAKTYTNRLIDEKSPYLLAHAHNPVDWYTWGEEAFLKAKEEDKPLFVSIGYSACHWCHVMEKESFEDENVARILNDYFISIKVDREERPDIDTAYMQACEILGSSGGWPLSVFMDYTGKPFFIGTYFPKEDTFGMAGFKSILSLIANFWADDRKKLLSAGDKVSQILKNQNTPSEIKLNWLKDAASYIKKVYDQNNGGFIGAPKFPMASTWLFMLRYSRFYNDKSALEITKDTLDKMALGGIYDQIEGGFFRYSTDETWTVPHFEKMLYDNAQLIELYAEGYYMTGKKEYAGICDQTIEFLYNNLHDKKGGFYTSLDADSGGEEGAYYIYSQEEIKKALPKEMYFNFLKTFPITKEGNFEEKNVLTRKTFENDNDLKTALILLKNLRRFRVKPDMDDKILSGQNGLMIAALSKAGRIFSNKRYITFAQNAADFVIQNMIIEGRLYSSYRDGLSKHKATQNDYAYFIYGLLELYEATLHEAYLLNAITLAEDMIEKFWDEKDETFLMTGNDVEKLYADVRDHRDGALPSGNAVAAQILFVISRLSGQPVFAQYAERILKSASGIIDDSPVGYTAHLTALIYFKTTNTEIVLTDGTGIDEMKKAVIDEYDPYIHTILKTKGSDFGLTYLIGYEEKEQALAYVCKNESCSQAIDSADDLINKLHEN